MIDTCEICGNPLQQEIIDISGDTPHWICSNCASRRSTCLFCVHYGKCIYDSDPSPLPKYVQKVINKGNVHIEQPVLNPERLREVCSGKCFCLGAENVCLRQNNYCEQYEFKWEKSNAT